MEGGEGAAMNFWISAGDKFVARDNMTGEARGVYKTLEDAIAYARMQGFVPWGSGRVYIDDDDGHVLWEMEKEECHD
jgi:hypothetical protein